MAGRPEVTIVSGVTFAGIRIHAPECSTSCAANRTEVQGLRGALLATVEPGYANYQQGAMGTRPTTAAKALPRTENNSHAMDRVRLARYRHGPSLLMTSCTANIKGAEVCRKGEKMPSAIWIGRCREAPRRMAGFHVQPGHRLAREIEEADPQVTRCTSKR